MNTARRMAFCLSFVLAVSLAVEAGAARKKIASLETVQVEQRPSAVMSCIDYVALPSTPITPVATVDEIASESLEVKTPIAEEKGVSVVTSSFESSAGTAVEAVDRPDGRTAEIAAVCSVTNDAAQVASALTECRCVLSNEAALYTRIASVNSVEINVMDQSYEIARIGDGLASRFDVLNPACFSRIWAVRMKAIEAEKAGANTDGLWNTYWRLFAAEAFSEEDEEE